MKTMKTISALLMAALMLSFVSVANNPKKAKPTAFKVDASKSLVKWHAKKVTGEHNGTVALKSGNFTMNGNKITGGNFEIDMTSIKCEDLTDAGYNAKLVNHLKSDDFFSVAKHPVATFKVTKVNGNDVTGDLTIKGITNSVTFPAVIKADKNGATASAKIVLDRTKWDVRYGSKKFFESIGDKAIYDDFTIDLTLAATK